MGVRPALEGTYGHGGGVMAAARLSGRAETDIDDFSTNCFFAAAPLTERLLGKTAWCSGSALLRYPDPGNVRLRAALAAREGMEPDAVIAGNGASELIWAALLALRTRGARRVLFLGPLFVQYARACAALGMETEQVLCPEDDSFLPDAAALDGVARSGADVVIVCSPNNPGTGILRDFSPLLDAVGRRVLLLDASYRGFLPEGDPGALPYPSLAGEAERNGAVPGCVWGLPWRRRSLSPAWMHAGRRGPWARRRSRPGLRCWNTRRNIGRCCRSWRRVWRLWQDIWRKAGCS